MGIIDAVALSKAWLGSSCHAETIEFDGSTYTAQDVALSLANAVIEFHKRATEKAEERALYDALATEVK